MNRTPLDGLYTRFDYSSGKSNIDTTLLKDYESLSISEDRKSIAKTWQTQANRKNNAAVKKPKTAVASVPIPQSNKQDSAKPTSSTQQSVLTKNTKANTEPLSQNKPSVAPTEKIQPSPVIAENKVVQLPITSNPASANNGPADKEPNPKVSSDSEKEKELAERKAKNKRFLNALRRR